ncbi:MAG: hypothetical protein RBT74_16900 [Tenuifilaceae bacterium]|jgi:hypothetical protein|nr:hypothetical protein [Tenuifilaceae bacterium]
MRKLITAFLALLITMGNVSVFGQGQGGGITAELNGNLFVQDDLLLTPTYLKARFFISDELAVRFTTWVDFSSHQNVPESTLNFFSMAARPGIEYHVASEAGVFAAYVGAEIIFDYAQHSFDTSIGVPISGAWSISDIHNFQNRGFMSFGGGIVGGADVYFGGTVYVGTELGLAYKYTNHAEVLYGTELFLGKSKSSQFYIDLSRVIRIGFMIK